MSATIGGTSSEDITRIIDDVRAKLFHADNIILMGKSWGGLQAQNYIETHPTRVHKMVLVAPAMSAASQIAAIKSAGVPLLLLWAEDDRVIHFRNAAKWTSLLDSGQIEFVSAAKGGHAVLSEYSEKILKFISRQ